MIIFHSGGSPIVETTVKTPNLMLSFAVDVKERDNKPNSRLRLILKQKRREKNGKRRRNNQS